MVAEVVHLRDEVSGADARKQGEVREFSQGILDKVDKHLAVVLYEEPRNAGALAIRTSVSRMGGQVSTTPEAKEETKDKE
jgi:hypothetical protein